MGYANRQHTPSTIGLAVTHSKPSQCAMMTMITSTTMVIVGTSTVRPLNLIVILFISLLLSIRIQNDHTNFYLHKKYPLLHVHKEGIKKNRTKKGRKLPGQNILDEFLPMLACKIVHPARERPFVNIYFFCYIFSCQALSALA